MRQYIYMHRESYEIRIITDCHKLLKIIYCVSENIYFKTATGMDESVNISLSWF